MNRSQGYSDAFYGPDYVVQGVIPGGLADSAGFRPGDRVVTVESIPVEGLGMQSRWPRALAPRVGQTQRFVVERGGELITLHVTYGPTPRSVIMLRLGAALVGLAFLWAGVWALFKVGTVHAEKLAAIGLAAGVGMLGMGPNLGRLNGVVGHISFASLILWAALLLRFFLTYPITKRAGASAVTTGIIYGLWVLFLPLLVLELVTHPALYHT
ncbi:MAG TPA: PDZ domain-containing protein, partial [Gemmatimonadales bacterium]|nr:PDZ domain-containing protein [Gemmatimonadales bacterium]